MKNKTKYEKSGHLNNLQSLSSCQAIIKKCDICHLLLSLCIGLKDFLVLLFKFC